MPPLDRLRKIRRDILITINDYRARAGQAKLYPDMMGNEVATAYAEFLLENQENPEKLKELCANNFFPVEVKPLVGMSFLDDEEDPTEKLLYDEYMDAHGLLLEIEEELQTIMSKDYTHVAIGFAVSKECVKVVELFSYKPLVVEKVEESADNGVLIRGAMLSAGVGIYAARIMASKHLKDGKKEVKTVGPYAINFDKNSKQFEILLEGPLEDVFYNQEDTRIIEVYVREKQIDKIVYGGEVERVDVKHLKCVLRMPVEFYPDPRILIEDGKDEQDREAKKREQEEREARMRQEQKAAAAQRVQDKLEKLRANKKEGDTDGESQSSHPDYASSKRSKTVKDSAMSPGGEGSQKDETQGQRSGPASQRGQSLGPGEEEESEDEEDPSEDSDKMGNLEQQSHTEMKQELIDAIKEDLRIQQELKAQNDELQRNIIAMDPSLENQDRQQSDI